MITKRGGEDRNIERVITKRGGEDRNIEKE